MAVGIAQAAFDRALSYSKERNSSAKALSEFQITQFKLADMAMKIELARTMVYKAAWLKDQGRPFTKEAAMCKLYASEIAMEIANEAIQIHGGYGYMKEYEVERYMRDAKLLEIGEGTSEVQRMVIAKTNWLLNLVKRKYRVQELPTGLGERQNICPICHKRQKIIDNSFSFHMNTVQ